MELLPLALLKGQLLGSHVLLGGKVLVGLIGVLPVGLTPAPHPGSRLGCKAKLPIIVIPTLRSRPGA